MDFKTKEEILTLNIKILIEEIKDYKEDQGGLLEHYDLDTLSNYIVDLYNMIDLQTQNFLRYLEIKRHFRKFKKEKGTR